MDQPATSAAADALALSELMFPTAVPCIAVAAQYRIADLLADGPLAIEELAEKSGTHARSLYKVLQRLTEDGIFAEVEAGVFRNTPMSELLRPDVPYSLHSIARMIGEHWLWTCWGRLDHSVATGKPAFDEIFGTNAWAWFAEHPGSACRFNQAMTEFSEVLSGPLARAYPEFGQARVVADLGGGQGSFLATILRTYPSIGRGILVDQPSVVEQARARADLAALADAGRFEFAPGDFFATVPAGVDVYVTKQVAHSWDDDRLVRLLRTCRETSPAARVVMAEMVQHPGAPRFAKDFNLTMLITMHGDIRSAEEFREVFRRAGYRLNRIIATGTTFSLVEGFPDE